MDESEYMISMFIDDELGLDEKIEFVEKIHASNLFKEDTIALLNQEIDLSAGLKDSRPLKPALPRRRFTFFAPRQMKVAVAVMAVAVMVLSAAFFLRPTPEKLQVAQERSLPHRFIIYEPDARLVEVAGSFTGWKKIPLEAGSGSGYWEVTLDLSPGEHRFTYILDGSLKVADPTVSSIESDDFGGENSILYTGDKA